MVPLRVAPERRRVPQRPSRVVSARGRGREVGALAPERGASSGWRRTARPQGRRESASPKPVSRDHEVLRGYALMRRAIASPSTPAITSRPAPGLGISAIQLSTAPFGLRPWPTNVWPSAETPVASMSVHPARRTPSPKSTWFKSRIAYALSQITAVPGLGGLGPTSDSPCSSGRATGTYCATRVPSASAQEAHVCRTAARYPRWRTKGSCILQRCGDQGGPLDPDQAFRPEAQTRSSLLADLGPASRTASRTRRGSGAGRRGEVLHICGSVRRLLGGGSPRFARQGRPRRPNRTPCGSAGSGKAQTVQQLA